MVAIYILGKGWSCRNPSGEEHMTDLTEKNLEAVLLNLTKTDRPITVKPTTCFGNPAKTAQWYTCPNCAKQSPLTLEWVGLTEDEVNDLYNEGMGIHATIEATEAKLKEKNNG
jgi:hypothetical protein